MAKSSSTDLFKNLPIQAGGYPISDPVEEAPIEDPVEPDEPEDEPDIRVSELDMLKQRATLMGIKFSNNISLPTLRTKVQARLDGEPEQTEPEEEAPVAASNIAIATPRTKAEELQAIRDKMLSEEMKLVRLRITNLDPKKKDLSGEIFTVANKIVGAVKKFIPYGAATDNGYHVPHIIYQQLKEREFLNIKTRKDNRGRTIIESGMAREFALEVLPQLDERDLRRLAASQAAAAGMSD